MSELLRRASILESEAGRLEAQGGFEAYMEATRLYQQASDYRRKAATTGA